MNDSYMFPKYQLIQNIMFQFINDLEEWERLTSIPILSVEFF